MAPQIGPYPKRGVDLRNFIKTVKTRNRSQYERVKAVNKGGLYYFSKTLQPNETKKLLKDAAMKKSVVQGADAQVKIGAAGLKGKSKNADGDFKAKGTDVMARNRIPGRLQMYVGHQGMANPKLHGVRSMPYGKVINNKNSNIDESEKAMKKAMASLARPASQGGHPGVDVANQAYTLDADSAMEEQERAKKEWYVVDWDETHPQSGVSTHQAITSAMNKWQPKDNSRVQQFQVSQGQPTTVPQPTERPAPRFNFPTLTAVPSQINRSVDLYIPASTSKGAQKARTNLSELNVKIKQLQEQLRKAEKARWTSRQALS